MILQKQNEMFTLEPETNNELALLEEYAGYSITLTKSSPSAVVGGLDKNTDDFLTIKDIEGTPYYEYALQYQHNGKNWGLNFFATSDEDALAKVQSLKDSLVLEGKISQRVSA